MHEESSALYEHGQSRPHASLYIYELLEYNDMAECGHTPPDSQTIYFIYSSAIALTTASHQLPFTDSPLSLCRSEQCFQTTPGHHADVLCARTPVCRLFVSASSESRKAS